MIGLEVMNDNSQIFKGFLSNLNTDFHDKSKSSQFYGFQYEFSYDLVSKHINKTH